MTNAEDVLKILGWDSLEDFLNDPSYSNLSPGVIVYNLYQKHPGIEHILEELENDIRLYKYLNKYE